MTRAQNKRFLWLGAIFLGVALAVLTLVVTSRDGLVQLGMSWFIPILVGLGGFCMFAAFILLVFLGIAPRGFKLTVPAMRGERYYQEFIRKFPIFELED